MPNNHGKWAKSFFKQHGKLAESGSGDAATGVKMVF
jgi:hypothetical protein